MKAFSIVCISAIIARVVSGFIPLDSLLFDLSSGNANHARAGIAGQCAFWEFAIITVVIYFFVKLIVDQIFT